MYAGIIFLTPAPEADCDMNEQYEHLLGQNGTETYSPNVLPPLSSSCFKNGACETAVS